MSDMDFICPTCKRPTRPTDNEIIEYLVKENDGYRDILGKRTEELIRTKELLEIESREHELCHDAMVKRTEEVNRTRKALDVAKEGLKEIQDKGEYVNPIELAESYLDEITALEQKDK